MREVSQAVINKYADERSAVQKVLAQNLRDKMSSLVGNKDHSDVVLISSDGEKVPAHLCILKQRAPGFYSEFILPQLGPERPSPAKKPRSGEKASISLPEVDSHALKFFLKSIYTDEEVLSQPKDAKIDRNSPRGSSPRDPESSDRPEPSDRSQHSPTQKDSADGNKENQPDYAADCMEPETESAEPLIEAESVQQVHAQPLESSVEIDLSIEEKATTSFEEISKTESEVLLSPDNVEDEEEPQQQSENKLEQHQEEEKETAEPESEKEQQQPAKVLMTSFKELALESPTTEIVDFPQEQEAVDVGNLNVQESPSDPEPATPDSFNDRTDPNISLTEPFEMAAEGLGPDVEPQPQLSAEGEVAECKFSFDETAKDDSGSAAFRQEDRMIGKFIHMDEISANSETAERSESVSENLPPKPALENKKMFPIFIEFDTEKPIVKPKSFRQTSMDDVEQDESFAMNGAAGTFAQIRKRLSIGSLRSLDSADLALSPSQDFQREAAFPPKDQEPSSKLARDLLNMLLGQKDCDVQVQAEGGEMGAHKAILSATCPYFARMLSGDWKESRSNTIDLSGFPYAVVHFTLCFLYGGVTTLPDDVTVWEVLEMADMLDLDGLKQVACLHIKAKCCHFFHKPCGSCIVGVLDIFPKLKEKGLDELADRCLSWLAKHFARIWKTRAFANLDEDYQDLAYQGILDSMTPQNVMDTLLGCEKLQATLPRSPPKHGGPSFENVGAMVACLTDVSVEFLAANFDRVVTTDTFLNQGRGLALNLGFLEDILPGVMHSLTPDTGCRVLVRLYELLVFLVQKINEQNRMTDVLEVDWNERFVNLMKRLYELCDTHLIHCAAAVTKCDSWKYLTPAMQERIKESKKNIVLNGVTACHGYFYESQLSLL